jgi:hypothetical protein
MPNEKPRLKLAIAGLTGSGKTRIALTAEEAIGAILVDPNGRDTVMAALHGRGEWKGKPRRIFVPKVDLRAPLFNPIRLGQLIKEAEAAVARGEKDPTQLIHKEHMMRVQSAIGELCVDDRVRTILIDGANKIHQSASFAEHGRIEKVMQRERGEMNRILTDIMQAPDLAGKHTIITAEAGSRYVDVTQRSRDGQSQVKSVETQFLKRGGWGGLGGTVRVEAMSMFCNDNMMVDRANFILEDHFDGFVASGAEFWKRVRKRNPRSVDSCVVGDFLLILQQSKDNVDLLIGEREWSVFVNKEITFPELYRRVWDRELADDE